MRRLFKLAIGLFSVNLLALAAAAQTSAQYPPSGQAGQCFARVLAPEIIETVTEQVEITAVSTQQIIVPAMYETQNIRVLVKEASTLFRAVPAVYKTVTEEILFEPESEVLVAIPATYETWTEVEEIAPAKAVWKSGDGLYGRGAAGTGTAPSAGNEIATGELLCRVMEPAKTRTVRRTRMVEPPRTERRIIPAKYKTVSRQVVSIPPRVEEIPIPAEYLDIPVSVMLSPASTQIETIPATYRTVERKVLVSTGGLQWAEVLCETNTTRTQIAAIQRGLTTAGYTTTADGAYGPQTQRSMESFQRANGLAVGYMTVETVRALSLDPYV